MNEKGFVMLMFGIIGTLLLILILADYYGGGMTIVAQGVSQLIVGIMAFAACISVIVILIRGRS